MFVWSFKMTRRELIILAAGIVAFVIIVCMLLIPGGNKNVSASPSEGAAITFAASNAEERLAFLKQFGWDVKPDPMQVKEFVMPADFDEVFKSYNELQTAQGFDLTDYKGERVTLWTYSITNYPGQETGMIANMLIKNGRVIGGDITSTELEGFMVGFDPNQNAAEQAAAQTMDDPIDRSVPASIPPDSDAPPEDDE